jgi:hypothetical protein
MWGGGLAGWKVLAGQAAVGCQVVMFSMVAYAERF